MDVQNRILKSAFDTRLGGREITHFAYLAAAADETLMVGTDATTGLPLSEPSAIAQRIGTSLATTYRALTTLDQLGYIQWNRGKRIKGGGTIRILMPSNTQSA